MATQPPVFPNSEKRPFPNQSGIALLTVMVFMVVITLVGIAALTITGMESRIAGFMRAGEVAASAAESCIGTGVQLLEQTLAGGQMPAGIIPPVVSAIVLGAEILGQDDNNPDVAGVTPNTSTTVGTYVVNGDIDRLFIEPKSGASLAFDEANIGSLDIIYRITCVASNAATGSTRTIVATYACTFNPDGCLKAI